VTITDALTDCAERDPQEFLAPRQRPHRELTGPVDVVAVWDLAHVLPDAAVAVVRDAGGQVLAAPMIVVDGRARRAAPGDGVSAAMVTYLAARHPMPEGFTATLHHTESTVGERGFGVDQTNESVVVGERGVVKWMTQLRAEPPAPVRIEALVAAHYPYLPQPWAFVWWSDSGGRLLVAAVAELLPDATDGWTWCVDDVRRFANKDLSLAAALEPVTTAGLMTAELHRAFAHVGAEQVSSLGVVQWRQLALDLLAQTVELVDGPKGVRLRQRVPAMRTLMQQLDRVDSTWVIPIHGDLHVGQILRYPKGGAWGYAVTDFDGNPVIDGADKQPPARDVAGFVQSLDHVGRVVIRRTPGVDEERVRRWMTAAQSTFLDTYVQVLADDSYLWDDRLLVPFQVEQECREFRYAVTQLPHWGYVPDAALADLVPLDSTAKD